MSRDNSTPQPPETHPTETQPTTIHVFFDTNGIKSGSGTLLVSNEVKELIEGNSSHPELDIRWCLPDVVREERRQQMQKVGKALLASLPRFEKFLGRSLGVDDSTVIERVAEAIEADVRNLGITIVPLDPEKVDLRQVIADSLSRKPPFEVDADDGKERERGFRDRMIGETVLQFLSRLGETSDTEVILVTGDGPLEKFMKERSVGRTNFSVVGSAAELGGRINAVVSKVPLQYIAELEPKAARVFFEADVRTSLFYTARTELQTKYSEILNSLPEGAQERVDGRWSPEPPRFVEKKADRIYWVTRIVLNTEAFAEIGQLVYFPTKVAMESASTTTAVTADIPVAQDRTEIVSTITLPSGSIGPFSTKLYLPSGADPSSRVLFNRRQVATGKTVFEVQWSVAITPTQELRDARVEGTNVQDTEWDWIALS